MQTSNSFLESPESLHVLFYSQVCSQVEVRKSVLQHQTCLDKKTPGFVACKQQRETTKGQTSLHIRAV